MEADLFGAAPTSHPSCREEEPLEQIVLEEDGIVLTVSIATGRFNGGDTGECWVGTSLGNNRR